MAPEQLRGEQVTAKSDIYALGMLLYEIFTGKRAYEASTMAELIRLQEGAQITSMSSIAAEIDPTVEKAIRRCLDPDPAKRPATALMVAAALPGGDPLAAALAAGETPSPDLVAASGETHAYGTVAGNSGYILTAYSDSGYTIPVQSSVTYDVSLSTGIV